LLLAGDRFRIGSITKTFTAAVLLQLVGENALALDDPLDRHYLGFPRGDVLTLRHLASHTSGIYDVAYDGEVVGNSHEKWDPDDLIAIAAAEPALFAPGAEYSYSNTNYLLLGRVIENATGRSFAGEVRARLLDRFRLEDTFVETDEPVPGGMARGYFVGADLTDQIDPSTGWAAGGMVSNATDVVRWLELLVDGPVHAPELRDAMQERARPADGSKPNYGIGLHLEASEHGVLYGHSGDAVIYRADAQRLRSVTGTPGMTVVVLVNGYPYEALPIARAVWELLLE
jgi:D-alanyl-D-alanine carboxypeptidase